MALWLNRPIYKPKYGETMHGVGKRRIRDRGWPRVTRLSHASANSIPIASTCKPSTSLHRISLIARRPPCTIYLEFQPQIGFAYLSICCSNSSHRWPTSGSSAGLSARLRYDERMLSTNESGQVPASTNNRDRSRMKLTPANRRIWPRKSPLYRPRRN